ncbi:hypothetical protein [Serinibacter salmoneus]|uniref:Uncharacterized protein n=1 Tax=Serinibacter salmoneus TaxID=556530 RepID=A0A2A9D206_9MICO|nr:hypothetical protein [Serinibacter salmoneus]PFG20704.1 hypothetical protein ATL40_2314 [Serinibacter salmoneus]
MTHIDPTDEARLTIFYEAAYAYLRRHPEFDGRARPGHPAITRAGVDPREARPWPGVADVRRMTCEQWVAARLEAVRAGSEEPALRLG